MRIFSWNVNGLRSIMSKNFEGFLEEYSPDVLCLQETRMSPEALEKLGELPFKNALFSHSDKKGYSGTAILTNLDVSDGGEILMDGHPREGRLTRAKIGGCNIFSVYAPNSQHALARLKYRIKWDVDFRRLVKSFDNVVACGDFNVAHSEIDLANPEENRLNAGFSDEEREDFSELLDGACLSDVWRERNPGASGEYTWWSYRFGARRKNIGWRIDYALVSRTLLERVARAELLQKVEGSDHCPIMIELR